MGVRVNASGMHRILDKVKKAAEPQQVKLVDLLHPDFIQRYSNFSDFRALVAASGIDISEDGSALNSEEFNTFIVENTRFDSFQQMQKAAAAELIKKQLRI